APLAELAAPGADDLRAGAVYGVAVGRDRVIREVSADDRAKPSTLLVDGVMTTPRKNRLESLERGAHPLLVGATEQQEPSRARPAADVDETEEAERLGRAAFTALHPFAFAYRPNSMSR